MGWWSDVTDTVSNLWSGASNVVEEAVSNPVSTTEDLFGTPLGPAFVTPDSIAGQAVANYAGGQMGNGFDDDVINDWFDSEGIAHPDFSGWDPQQVIRDYGSVVPSGIFQQAGVTQTGALGGAMMAGAGLAARSLWGVLRAGGATFSSFISKTGVRARMTDLWPAVRKYGSGAVGAALGLTAIELATLLTQAPTNATRTKRRRGISARDVSTTKRVVGFVNTMSRQIGCVSRPRARYAPRGRGRARYYH